MRYGALDESLDDFAGCGIVIDDQNGNVGTDAKGVGEGFQSQDVCSAWSGAPTLPRVDRCERHAKFSGQSLLRVPTRLTDRRYEPKALVLLPNPSLVAGFVGHWCVFDHKRAQVKVISIFAVTFDSEDADDGTLYELHKGWRIRRRYLLPVYFQFMGDYEYAKETDIGS